MTALLVIVAVVLALACAAAVLGLTGRITVRRLPPEETKGKPLVGFSVKTGEEAEEAARKRGDWPPPDAP